MAPPPPDRWDRHGKAWRQALRLRWWIRASRRGQQGWVSPSRCGQRGGSLVGGGGGWPHRTLGLSSLQKMTAALRILAYGVAADSTDDVCCSRLTKSVDFQGMLGSIDYMHWKWKNCPTAWKGQYTGHSREPTLILEAVASYDRWIWHAFFGLPGSHNDINVLEHSSIFTELTQGRAPPVNYSINGHDYTMGYYLADDERDPNGVQQDDDYEQVPESIPIPVSREPTIEVQNFIQSHIRIRDRETHSQLQADLVRHLWQLHGQS
uniref:DDE Tnp4 domain-containing protein n=1 Tax=Fagus sylvatica TaxID=28930 RepID=A0A2N9F603_FAGSY